MYPVHTEKGQGLCRIYYAFSELDNPIKKPCKPALCTYSEPEQIQPTSNICRTRTSPVCIQHASFKSPLSMLKTRATETEHAQNQASIYYVSSEPEPLQLALSVLRTSPACPVHSLNQPTQSLLFHQHPPLWRYYGNKDTNYSHSGTWECCGHMIWLRFILQWGRNRKRGEGGRGYFG